MLSKVQILNDEAQENRSLDFLEVFKQRRSVRAFQNRPAPKNVLLNAIKAATYSPSGANRQPWHFTLVTENHTKSLIRQKAETVERSFYQNQAHHKWIQDLQFLETNETKTYLEEASALIIVSIKSKVLPLEKEFATKRAYYPKESVGIAIGVLLSSLQYSGLNTLTHTPIDLDFLKEILGLEKNCSPLMIIAVGYASPHYHYPLILRRSENEVIKVIS